MATEGKKSEKIPKISRFFEKILLKGIDNSEK